MSVNLISPSRNACTHTSLAALYTAGAVPPRVPASRASRTAGNASSSRGKNSQACGRVQSTAGAASATRSGQPRPRAMGIIIDGGEAWASVEPSWNSTIECTTDVGCTTTSIRSNGMPNSRCASITSSPLLTRVAELMVTNGPMSQVGCASACAGVTSCSSSRVRPRNGPPLAVSTRRRTSSPRPARRHCASALCSLSTGTIWPGLARAVTTGPPMISDSLLASARVLPASSAASVGRSPTAPVMPLSTTSHSIAAARDDASSPRSANAGRNSSTWARKRSACDPPAVSPTPRNRSGAARTTSRAWVPMEPVEPSRTTSRREGTGPSCRNPRGGDESGVNAYPSLTISSSNLHIPDSIRGVRGGSLARLSP